MTLVQYFVLSITVLVTYTATAEMTDVSCVYETSEFEIQHSENHSHHDRKSQKPAKWYFWRTDKTVEVSNEEQSFGEKWRIGGKKHIFYQALYHDKKFLLDFQPADLNILGQQRNWAMRSTLLSENLLKQLKQTKMGRFNNYDKIRYQGKVSGIEYTIDWIPELNLPSLIEKRTSEKTIVTELKEVYPLSNTPYKQQVSEKYDDMDYADIGDNESHPIVSQLQKNSGIGYFHQH